MDQNLGARLKEPRRREPEFQAAVVNGVLILLLVPVAAFYSYSTSDAVSPVGVAFRSALAITALGLLLVAPVAFVAALRTYVHARSYRINPATVWRGPGESAAIFGGIALLLMVRATAANWSLFPFYQVIGYIAFYVAATAIVGFVFGLALAGVALLVIHSRT